MKFTAMVKELEDHRAEVLNRIEQKVKEAFKTLSTSCFSDNPGLYAIHWCQYTPYFNDGDECIFSVGDIYALFEDSREQFEEGDYDFVEDLEGVVDLWDISRKTDKSPGEEALSALDNLLSLDPDIMKSMFGDHVQVTLTYVDGEVVVATDGYEHD